MDDGYLFFNVEPTEVAVHGNVIDLEMRIFEGPQATIDEVIIKGNTRTHEHVIRRELRTQPGQKFSRSDIIRSQRQIIALGYFNPENLGIQTPVDQTNGTVDIIYEVEEKPSDQLELSAGWGGFGRSKIIGTLGVTFNNFSLRNLFNREAWSPLAARRWPAIFLSVFKPMVIFSNPIIFRSQNHGWVVNDLIRLPSVG